MDGLSYFLVQKAFFKARNLTGILVTLLGIKFCFLSGSPDHLHPDSTLQTKLHPSH